ncbi:MAG: short-chain fatty acyl-CoA regulator family protein [Pseudomonadota bacterium]
MPETRKKLFVGPRMRRIRRELGLTQARMANELDVSPSYINLIERNQRPVSAPLLLKFSQAFDIELRTLADDDDEDRLLAGLNEAFSDPIFQNAGLSGEDLHELATGNPVLADAVTLLYRAYRDAESRAEEAAGAFAIDGVITRDGDRAHAGEAPPPIEQTRDFLQAHGNYFGGLDEAAERLHEELTRGSDDLYTGLSSRLAQRHGLRVQIMPTDVMGALLRRLDRHGGRVLMSEVLEQPARSFQLAFQLATLEQRDAIEDALADSPLIGEDALRLARISLANYFAAAVLMPYGAFLKAAADLGYDLEMLGRRFAASFEQVCHRLTTLRRPGEAGPPFFMIRADVAGNISKRFAGDAFPFSRHGGACPRWNVHDVFRSPGRVQTQIVRLPSNETYFSIARTVRRPGRHYGALDQELAVGLGCDIRYADRLIYARGLDLEDDRNITPIGINCRLCERPDCLERAHPPLRKKLVMDENRRTASPFAFAFD